MSDEKFTELKLVWGIDGMPADKTKLVTAAFKDGRAAGIAWAERFTAEQCVDACLSTKDKPDCFGGLDQLSEYGNTAVDCCVAAIKEKFGLEI